MDIIIPGKDYFLEVLVAQTTDPDAAYAPASGRSDVHVWFSDTEAGAAIDTTLDITQFTESGTKLDDDGTLCARYVASLLGAATATLLGARTGDIIWQNEQIGTHDATSVPIRVRRRPA